MGHLTAQSVGTGRDSRRHARLTWFELALIALLVCLAIILSLPAASRALGADRGTQCQNNLKQLGLAFKMYASESRSGLWPPVSSIEGNWIPDTTALYPHYLTDLDLFICPAHPDSSKHRFRLYGNSEHPYASVGGQHPDCVSSRYYVYTGFVTSDDYDAIAVHDSLMLGGWRSVRGGDLNSTLPYALDLLDSGGSGVVMWDRLSFAPERVAHVPIGANVLFMDGHIEFQRYYPDTEQLMFPITPVATELFATISTHLSPDCTPE